MSFRARSTVVPPPRRRRVSVESPEQRRVVALLGLINAAVFESGTKRPRPNPDCPVCLRNQSTRQTPGIPDVEAFIDWRTHVLTGTAIPPTLLKYECKAPGLGEKAMSPAQRQYRALCERTGIWHVVGDYTALLQALVDRGYLHPKNVPHYRLAAPPSTETSR